MKVPNTSISIGGIIGISIGSIAVIAILIGVAIFGCKRHRNNASKAKQNRQQLPQQEKLNKSERKQRLPKSEENLFQVDYYTDKFGKRKAHIREPMKKLRRYPLPESETLIFTRKYHTQIQHQSYYDLLVEDFKSSIGISMFITLTNPVVLSRSLSNTDEDDSITIEIFKSNIKEFLAYLLNKGEYDLGIYTNEKFRFIASQKNTFGACLKNIKNPKDRNKITQIDPTNMIRTREFDHIEESKEDSNTAMNKLEESTSQSAVSHNTGTTIPAKPRTRRRRRSKETIASRVSLDDKEPSSFNYITTRAPVTDVEGSCDTRFDFWRMVCKENVKIVVMLVNIPGSVYFPSTYDEGENELTFTKNSESVTVTCVADGWQKPTVKHLKIQTIINGQPCMHEVYHISFDKWNKPQAPNPEQFLRLLESFYAMVGSKYVDERLPIVVQDLNGYDRSGFFITLVEILKQTNPYSMFNKPPSVVETIKELRRKGELKFVPNKEQYIIIFKFFHYLIGNEVTPLLRQISLEAHMAEACELKEKIQKFGKALLQNNEIVMATSDNRLILAHQVLEFEFSEKDFKVTTVNLKSLKVGKLMPNGFDMLKDRPDWQGEVSTASSSLNTEKNRYRDILPYNNRLVHLYREHNMYFSASYILPTAFDEKRNALRGQYIACNGPMENTIYAFWLMIIDEQSPLIVMLTNFEEKSGPKCDKYFPVGTDEMLEATDHIEGSITVKCKDTLEKEGLFTIRKFEVKFFHCRTVVVTRIVTHLFFEAWPDKDVPSLENFAKFFMVYQEQKTQTWNGHPIVVHCSAGVGRTGTFITLDKFYASIIQSSCQPREISSLVKFINLLREDRSTMVQTREQMVFIFEMILCSCGWTEFLRWLLVYYIEQERRESERLKGEQDHKISLSSEIDSASKNLFDNLTLI